MADYEIFELGDVVLQCGITLRKARIAYKTYGKLAPARDNVIVMPTFYGGQHTDTEPMMQAGRALDLNRYFVIVPNMFGNGLVIVAEQLSRRRSIGQPFRRSPCTTMSYASIAWSPSISVSAALSS